MISFDITDKSVTFDRDHYCKHREIYERCTQDFGSSIDLNPRWKWQQIFGYTTIWFNSLEDYRAFSKWVRKNRKSLVYNEAI